MKRADGEWRGVFEQDVTESIHVLPHYDLLCVSARVLVYTPEHFTKVDKVLRELIPKHFPEDYRSPHDLWHFAVHSKLKDGSTFFSRALKRYETIVQDARRARHAKPDRA